VFYKYILFSALSILFFGCAASNQSALNNKPVQKSNYASPSNYYYALIEKNNGKWSIIDIKDVEIQNRAKTNQEILKINESLSEVVPNFALNDSNKYECDGKKGAKEYTACTSNLTLYAPPQNISALFGGGSKKEKLLNKELIEEIVKEINLFVAIEKKKVIFEREECDRLFLTAKTADEFESFVKRYSSYQYASTLIPIAQKNIDSLREQEQKRKDLEAKNAKMYEQKIQKSEKQLERENEALADLEEKAIRNFQKSVSNFRKTIKKGVETNCGKVLDVKGASVKVYFPVKNVGDDHWIDTGKIFPKSHGCRFVNGNYIAPATF
jgi:hypothetical protein